MFRITPFDNNTNSLFNAFYNFEKELFGSEANQKMKTDIRDEEDKYIVETDLPGFTKEDIHINIEGDYLTLKAERKVENDEKDKKGNYIRRERSYGAYQRTFNISEIDESQISAEYDKGVLTLTLPKKEEVVPKTRRLEIK